MARFKWEDRNTNDRIVQNGAQPVWDHYPIQRVKGAAQTIGIGKARKKIKKPESVDSTMWGFLIQLAYAEVEGRKPPGIPKKLATQIARNTQDCANIWEWARRQEGYKLMFEKLRIRRIGLGKVVRGCGQRNK